MTNEKKNDEKTEDKNVGSGESDGSRRKLSEKEKEVSGSSKIVVNLVIQVYQDGRITYRGAPTNDFLFMCHILNTVERVALEQANGARMELIKQNKSARDDIMKAGKPTIIEP